MPLQPGSGSRRAGARAVDDSLARACGISGARRRSVTLAGATRGGVLRHRSASDIDELPRTALWRHSPARLPPPGEPGRFVLLRAVEHLSVPVDPDSPRPGPAGTARAVSPHAGDGPWM